MKKIHTNANKLNLHNFLKTNINPLTKNPIKNFHIYLKTSQTNININIFNYTIKNTQNFSINKPQLKNFSQKNTKLDPYLILEVQRGADFKAIKTAYFKLARVRTSWNILRI